MWSLDPLIKGKVMWKVFPYHDVIMLSSYMLENQINVIIQTDDKSKLYRVTQI